MIKAKVCGINNSENLYSLLTLPVDMLGFVFDDTSEFNCTLSPKEVKKAFAQKNVTCKKVGVFVDAPLTEVLKKQEEYDLDYIQLNGQESIFYCQLLREHQLKLIKSFSVDNNFCYSNTSAYGFFCEYFSFDYTLHAYSDGKDSFNYDTLKNYKGKKSFFLNGDMNLTDVDTIRNVDARHLAFVNINENFDLNPGLKNIDLIADFIYQIKRPETFNINKNAKRMSSGF